MKKKDTKGLIYYIDKINKECQELTERFGVELFGFRGEEKIFDIPCQPNIFRDNYYDRIFNNQDFFEKNILDELRSHDLSLHEQYLLTAIDAQHGGFPSRLLDISFNALIALFFSVTPHYRYKVDENDHEDAIIYIFPILKLFSISDQGLVQYYEDIIDKKENKILDIYNYMFIGYNKTNPRIVAQHGGFILFPGNEFKKFPENLYRTIKIKHQDKSIIREELSRLFGINMSSIYPEPEHFVSSFVHKTLHMARYERNDLNKIRNIEFQLEAFWKELDNLDLENNDLESLVSKVIDDFEYFATEVRVIIEEDKNQYCELIKIFDVYRNKMNQRLSVISNKSEQKINDIFEKVRK